ncbi:PIN-like domain-containing protein [Bacillus pumilus]|uniref:PIN-like domain-containing protein n=1 Tax=Bacillus TaxID=1386 RepID=UPI003D1EAD20
MREKFREFYFDKNDEKIWQESIIILDTNVLLNLYRYTKETSDQILELLNKYKENLWMPHQVGLEYHYNRKLVILEQRGSNDKVCATFEKIPEKVREFLNDDLSSFKKRHKDDLESLVKEIKSVIEEKIKGLKNISQEEDLLEEDLIRLKINELYTDRVGDPYSEEELKAIMVDADDRFSKNIPPGYKDVKGKKGIKFYNGVQVQNKYGDYILWRQVLDYAKKNESNVIFLTDEKKEDWWYEAKGRTIGPRIELLNEFSFHSKKSFYMFSSIGFIEIKGGLDQSAVSEVKEVSEAYKDIAKETYNEVILYNTPTGKRTKTPVEIKMSEISDESKEELMYKFCLFIRDMLHVFNGENLYYYKFYELVKGQYGRLYTDIIMDVLIHENNIKLKQDESGRHIIDINGLSRYIYSKTI